MNHDKRSPYALGLLIVAIFTLFLFIPIHFIDYFELKLLDIRFRLSQGENTFDNIAIIEIDKKTEEALGRWPWDRDKHASLVDNISIGRPAVIGIDVVFSQPQESPVTRLLSHNETLDYIPPQRIEHLKDIFDFDKTFSKSLKDADNVVMGYYFFTEKKKEAVTPSPGNVAEEQHIISNSQITRVISSARNNRRAPLRHGSGVETNIRELSESATSQGFLNVFQDTDGVLRKAATAIEYEGSWYASFPAQIFKHYTSSSDMTMRLDEYGISELSIGKMSIPVDSSGAFLINYTIPLDGIKKYSYIDVLNGNVPAGAFTDKIVLVGITDPGLRRDIWTTPTDVLTPGINVHAAALATMIEGRYISYTNGVELLNIIFLIFTGLLITFAVIKFTRAVYGALLAGCVFSGYIALAFFFFRQASVWINMISPLSCIVMVYTTESLFYAIRGERKTKQIRNAFKSYVSPEIVEEIILQPEKLKLGGERKIVSVLFSDIKGFSTMSERLSPEELSTLLNRYFTPMTEIVFNREGTLDKYIGDALLAFFGAPLVKPDHALQATLASIEMTTALKKLQEEKDKEKSIPFHVGIGINTGDVSVGNMGSNMRFDYTVIGDNVNVAQRLEQLTRQYRNSILISESTYMEVKDKILCREIDITPVKGRGQHVRIYEPLALKEHVSSEISKVVKLFEGGLALFRGGKKREAARVFHEVLAILPEDGPSLYFLQKCDEESGEPEKEY